MKFRMTIKRKHLDFVYILENLKLFHINTFKSNGNENFNKIYILFSDVKDV